MYACSRAGGDLTVFVDAVSYWFLEPLGKLLVHYARARLCNSA
jgi:hypothetical protein